MTSPALDLARRRAAVTATSRGLAAPTARAVTSAALMLGVVADSLFRNGPGGAGFALWIALVALNLACLVWRDGRTLPREATAWLFAAALFACGLAWRNSDTLVPFDALATVGCLGMAVIRLRDRRAGMLAARFRQTLAAGVRMLATIAGGLLPVLRRELSLSSETRSVRRRTMSAARAALLGAAVLLVFGSLLRGADPVFASFLTLPGFDVGEMASHVVVIGFFAWIVTGWARSALLPAPEHRVMPYGFSLNTLDVTTVLATLDVLFAGFMLAQLGWIFGGEAFLRSRTGLTAAQYARQGFFQMAWVVALVIPVLVITRSALATGRDLRRRHTLLSLPAIGLLGAMVASAVLRMQMYVHYFGLTTDRLYPLVVMGWLSFVLVWLAATVLRGRGRTFAAGSLVSGLITLAALNVADPDAIVARANVARAGVDVAYLARLDGGAVELATQATLASTDNEQRCAAARTLLERWGPGSHARIGVDDPAAWRTWNADDTRALHVVRANSPALIRVMHAACIPTAKR